MNQTFKEKWLSAVQKKGSVLCAGLDPAEYEMGRKDEGLPEGVNKIEWAKEYIDAIAPYCAAIKPNSKYWNAENDKVGLKKLSQFAKGLGLVVIYDDKIADIGSTNEAGLYHNSKLKIDAVTIAPYAGNMKQLSLQVGKFELGAITMCLMSNSEYEREKNMLVKIPLKEENEYNQKLIDRIQGVPYIKRYIQLAHDAAANSLEGVVIGAPSPKKNHITEKELEYARMHLKDGMLVLLPGVGAQGGEAKSIWNHFDKDNVIVNIGRGLMFPNGSNSTPAQQEKAAENYKDMLNEARAA